jgi:hypothetical protein
VSLVFESGELAPQVAAAAAQLGAALVDIADEVLVDFAGEFEVADQPLAPGFCLGDGPADRGDLAGARPTLLPCG